MNRTRGRPVAPAPLSLSRPSSPPRAGRAPRGLGTARGQARSVGEVPAEGVELCVPEAAVVRDPAGGAGERRAPEPAVVGPAPALAREQAGALEDAQVLGNRRQRG